MDEGLAAALALIAASGADALEVVRAWETVKCRAEAGQLEAMRQVSVEEPAFIDPFGQLVDPVPAEIACALSWTSWTASRRVDLAHDLHDNLPCVLVGLRSGRIDLAKATEIATGTCELPPDTRVTLADRAVDYATTHTRGQLRAWLARQITRLHPEAAEKRRKKAKKQRRVWVQPEPDGMATLGAYLSAEEAAACLESLRHGVANHEGGVDAARADLLIERLIGITPGQPIPVQVLLTPAGPELTGHGPISQTHAEQLCTGLPPIRLHRPAPTIGYTPSVALVHYVKARDRRCRFPGCRRPATHCDLDHITPWPTGLTADHNLQALCRYHHRLKTHTDWTVTIDPDATTHWTSPRGHRYTTRPDDP